MRRTFSITLQSTLTLLFTLLSTVATAGDGTCARCGCGACHQICRLVPQEKKVDVVCWGYKCEDFCLGGPSTPGCKNCEEVCDFGDQGKTDAPCSLGKRFVWTEWCPSWAKIHAKKKLMKRTVTKKVPSHKWVVEDLCDTCAAKTAASEVTLQYDVLPAAVAAPVAPVVDAQRSFEAYLR